MRLAGAHGGIDRAYASRFLAVAFTTAMTSPLRLYERLRWGRAVRGAAIHPSPLFVLGHWRTGTTHLQNLLCQDPQFGFLSTFQAMAPGFCLMGERLLKPLVARKAAREHPTREIDNIPLSLDAPQEENFGLANLTPCAPLHIYSYPRRAREIFAKYALLEGISPAERAEWMAAYLTLLRKASLRAGSKPLVLKDPANTGRIPALLDLFPQAKFIHICRDPYRVFSSTVGTWKVVLPTAQLQDVEPAEVERLVLLIYERLMRKYLAEREHIPAGNFVEVRFEDLERSPMEELRRVYETLSLPGFAAAAPALRRYAESVAGFQKNPYRVDDAVIETVNRHWQFALEAWSYARLEPQAKAAGE